MGGWGGKKKSHAGESRSRRPYWCTVSQKSGHYEQRRSRVFKRAAHLGLAVRVARVDERAVAGLVVGGRAVDVHLGLEIGDVPGWCG